MTVPISAFTAAANTTAIGCLTGYSLTGSNASNMIDLAGTWNTSGAPTALKIAITNTASGAAKFASFLAGAGGVTEVFSVDKAGNIVTAGTQGISVAAATNYGFYLEAAQTNGFLLGSTNQPGIAAGGAYQMTWVAASKRVQMDVASEFGWSSTSALSVLDLILARDAAGILAQRNSTNAQTLRVYNTYTDASNYERGVFDWGTSSNVLTIGAQATGGTLRNVALVGALITIPGLGSDAAHTDSTVCQDTTTHALYAGSGAVGICLGTSSLRFKTNVAPLQAGLAELLRIDPISYRYRPGYGTSDRDLYGFAAEQMVDAVPQLVGNDEQGRPNSVDWAGLLPVVVSAMKEQQEMIEALQQAVDELRATRH